LGKDRTARSLPTHGRRQLRRLQVCSGRLTVSTNASGAASTHADDALTLSLSLTSSRQEDRSAHARLIQHFTYSDSPRSFTSRGFRRERRSLGSLLLLEQSALPVGHLLLVGSLRGEGQCEGSTIRAARRSGGPHGPARRTPARRGGFPAAPARRQLPARPVRRVVGRWLS
jgi:hypothetical protein